MLRRLEPPRAARRRHPCRRRPCCGIIESRLRQADPQELRRASATAGSSTSRRSRASCTARAWGPGPTCCRPECSRARGTRSSRGTERRPARLDLVARRALRARRLRVLPFDLRGRYVNVNSRDDLNQANALVRDATFDTRTESLVYMVDDANAGDLAPILEFASASRLDEVLVVARRPVPGLERRAGPSEDPPGHARDARPAHRRARQPRSRRRARRHAACCATATTRSRRATSTSCWSICATPTW